MQRMLRPRPGFTLVEAVIAMVLTAIVGSAVVGVFVTQTRFYDRQEKASFARSASRGSLNLMMSEMRMVERTGAIPDTAPVSASRIRLRVPYRIGIACNAGGAGGLVALFMPVDAAIAGETAHSGHAWRNAAGAYTYVANSTPTAGSAANATTCASAGISTTAVAGSQVMVLSGSTGVVGQPVFMYREITYRFAASTQFPGRIGLWRTVHGSGKPTEEIAGPFAASSGFQFFTGSNATLITGIPTNMADVRGVRFNLNASSVRPDPDGTYPVLPLSTSVFFRNSL